MQRSRTSKILIPALFLLAFPAAVLAGDSGGTPKAPPPPDKDESSHVMLLGEGGAMRYKLEEPFGKGFLGVSLMDLTPELRQHFGVPDDAGVMVSRVDADSPAAKAGVKAGDIITALDGESVASSFDIMRNVRPKKEGDSTVLEIFRDGKMQKISASVAERERRVIEVHGLDRRGLPFKMSPADAAAMDQAMQSVRERVRSIDSDAGVRDRLMLLRSNREAELEKRLAALEKRLAELQKQIDNRNR